MTKTYGIAYRTAADTTIIECVSLQDAWTRATSISTEWGVDVVELEGSGPALDSDGEEIAPTHAPRRTIATLPYVSDERIERLMAESAEAGDVEARAIARLALAGSAEERLACARMLAEAISQAD